MPAPVSRQIVIYLVVSLGLERALRLVRFHREQRRLVHASWAAFTAVNMWRTSDRSIQRQVLHEISDGRLNAVYFMLVGLYFMYRLDSAPTMNFQSTTTQRALNNPYWRQ